MPDRKPPGIDAQPTDPFTEKERQYMRVMMENDRRWKWLAVTTRNFGGWLAAVVAGYFALGEILTRLKR